MLFKYSLAAILFSVNALFNPLIPSVEEPLKNIFIPSNGKFIWKVEHSNLDEYLKTSVNYICAHLSLKRTYYPKILWNRDCEGSHFEWDITEYTYNKQNYIKISQNVDGVDFFVDTNSKSFLSININSDEKRRSFQFTGNMADPQPTGILTTFNKQTSAITDRLCFNYEQATDILVPSKRRKFASREIRSAERLLFSKCNINKCNDGRDIDALCGSCNWVGNANTECEECFSFNQYVENGSCVNFPEDADCKVTMSGFLKTGIYNPSRDERSCTKCSRKNNKKCSTCAAKLQYQEEGETEFKTKTLEPSDEGICSCPAGTNLIYIDGRNPLLCAANCIDRNAMIDNELFKCKVCSENNPSRCGSCAGEGMIVNEDGECICTREDWIYDSEANECNYKNKEYVDRVNEKPAANLCLMFPEGTANRISCEASMNRRL